MDTFPYDSWEEAQAGAGAEGYFTFGPGDNPATIVLVAIAFLLMVVVFVLWMRTEDQKLREQATRIAAGLPSGEASPASPDRPIGDGTRPTMTEGM